MQLFKPISILLGFISIILASPNNGTVTSGNATISSNGTVTNINQSSSKASINWNNFSIGSNESVNFNQPNSSSITLNRVIGNEKSVIEGAMNANGQVWLLNSNGILFSKNASINTSGLLATTAELSDVDFQNGNYNFKNSSSNSVINLGTIKVENSSYVVLAGKEVTNGGRIEALKGKVHLVGANEYSINLNGNSLIELTVNKGVLDALVKNSGTIIADGGEIFLTTNAVNELLKGVVNNSGIIEANSLDDITGKVELFAHGGEVQVGGTIKAEGGFVETSGKDFTIEENAKIKTKEWLIDPTNITIESTGSTTDFSSSSIKASFIEDTLNDGTGVSLLADNNININENITWTNSLFTLTAGNNININAIMSASNTAQLSMNGTVNTNFANDGSFKGRVDLTIPSISINGNTYNVINNITSLQNISLSGNYVLGSFIDASATSNWNSNGSGGYYGFDPVGSSGGQFSGKFDGLGHTISNLYINRPSENFVGLFGWIYNGKVNNLGVINSLITGNTAVGGIAGANYLGTISNSYSNGTINGEGDAGGLVGHIVSGASIYNSYSLGSVSGISSNVGGLVGHFDTGIIENSYSKSNVTASSSVGGLVGYVNNGSITNTYSTGTVNITTDSGGLIGRISNTPSITNSFWNTQTSGQSTSASGTGKTTNEMRYIATFRDIGNWTIELDDTLADGPPILSYNDTGPVWKISPYTYNIPDVTITYGDGYSYTNTQLFGWNLPKTLGTDFDFYYNNNIFDTTNIYNNAGSYLLSIQFDSTISSDFRLGSGGTLTINKKDISSITGITASNKVYDQTTNATLDFSSALFTDMINGDNLTVGTSSGNFSDKNVANNKTVYITGLTLSGTDANNYNLVDTTASTTADITAKDISSITGITASNKVYDQTTNTTLDTSNALFTDMINGDNLTVGTSSGNFSDKNVANNKTVYITGLTLSGTDANNYNLVDTTASTTADITAKDISSITGITASNKVYDQTTNATLDTSNASFTNMILGDNLTVGTSSGNFSDKNVANNKTVYITGLTLSGTDANNYNLVDTTASTTADITAKDISSITGITASNKVYDQTTNATLDFSSALFTDMINGDNLTVGTSSGNFSDKNVANNKTVYITGLTLSGTDVNNYNLLDTTATTTADITAKKLVIDLSGQGDKIYDGTNLITLGSITPTITGVIGLDDVTVATGSVIGFVDKNVGQNKAVTFNGFELSGNDSSNYSLVSGSAPSTANITPKNITSISGITALDKTYDGTTTAILNTSNTSFSGIINGDNLSIGSSTGNFIDKNADTNKTVNITNLSLSGNDADNYNLVNTTATTTANIFRKSLLVTYTATDKFYDGSTSATVFENSIGLISGNSVNISETANFIDAQVGTNKTITISNITINGVDARNYSLSNTTATTTASILENILPEELNTEYEVSSISRLEKELKKYLKIKMITFLPDSIIEVINGGIKLPNNILKEFYISPNSN